MDDARKRIRTTTKAGYGAGAWTGPLALKTRYSDDLMQQIDTLTVVSKCKCGCPTVYFGVKGKDISRKGERIISDYLATVDDQDVGVMLFEVDGYLSSLDVYSCAGADKPFGLPSIETLYSYEELSKRRPLFPNAETPEK